jgi:hypothetical protein
MSNQQVIQFEYRQALAHDSDKPGWSETLDISVRLTSAALTSGWLRTYFAGRGNDFLVLLAIVMHARPLNGEDLDLLVQLGMASSEDRGRLYARITGMALAEELGMSRNTVRTCARRLAELNLIAERDIPDGTSFRDSHGKFDGVKVYLLSGVVEDWLEKDIQGHPDDAQLLSTDQNGAQKSGMEIQNGAQNLSSAQDLGAVEIDHAQRLGAADQALDEGDQPTARNCCAVGAQDLITNKSPVNVVVDPEIAITTTDSDSDAQIDHLNAALLAIGVYAHTAEDLLHQFAPRQIRVWLPLYDAARTSGLAEGPGWLVDALQKGWEIGKIRQQLGLSQTDVLAISPLPESLIDGLAEIGWCGVLDELERHYTSDQERFEGWLEHIRSNRHEYTRPAGILLNNLRAGLKAPKPGRGYDAYLSEQTSDLDDWDDDIDESESEDSIPEADLPEAVHNAWQVALAQLRSEMSPQLFNTWVRDARPLCYDEQEGALEVGVLNTYARDWLESRVTATLSRILESMLQHPVRVDFITI